MNQKQILAAAVHSHNAHPFTGKGPAWAERMIAETKAESKKVITAPAWIGWQAWFDGEEDRVVWGKTEYDAVEALLALSEES
jgi:hypothetical protein